MGWRSFANTGLPGQAGTEHLFVIGAALSYSERIQLFLTAPKAHPLQTVFQVTPDDPDSAWTLPWTQWPPSSLDGKSLVGLTAANLQEIKSHKGGDPVGRMQLWLTDGQNIYSTWKEAEGINQPWRPIMGPWENSNGLSLSFPNVLSFAAAPLPGSHLLKLWANDSSGHLQSVEQATSATSTLPGSWRKWTSFGLPTDSDGNAVPVTNITAVPLLNDGSLFVVATEKAHPDVIWSRYQDGFNADGTSRWPDAWKTMMPIP